MQNNPNTPITIAFLGNFSKDKGSEVFLSIVKKVTEMQLPVHWVILGGIGDQQALSEIQAITRVKTSGFYLHSEVPKLLKEYNITLGLFISQFPESYSKTLREFWHLGLPVIFHKIGITTTFGFSRWGVETKELASEVTNLIRGIVHNPKMILEEKERIQKASNSKSFDSKNKKHLEYQEIYKAFGLI